MFIYFNHYYYYYYPILSISLTMLFYNICINIFYMNHVIVEHIKIIIRFVMNYLKTFFQQSFQHHHNHHHQSYRNRQKQQQQQQQQDFLFQSISNYRNNRLKCK
uniref:Uncharacterized protein LOC113798035 n=1 Tax=Dermatophagoides pteronyssinus TaxID=6956 RepID=A0A6P6YHJ3_DERPT|nr:uncharacterized protein LOC113798035 [Dermatophagoides pteronyssinus]